MKRLFTAGLAALGLCLFASGAALAGPKDGAKASTCALGQGKAVCCKAYVADHCGPVTCCEVGNKSFFTKTDCAKCQAHAAERAEVAAKVHAAHAASHTASAKGSCASGSACSAADADPEMGNARFFSARACAAKQAACGASVSACCAAKK